MMWVEGAADYIEGQILFPAQLISPGDSGVGSGSCCERYDFDRVNRFRFAA
jgi:hypothetical protein